LLPPSASLLMAGVIVGFFLLGLVAIGALVLTITLA
jgi:hypothetical protein